MNSVRHVALGATAGALAALLPDAALYCFGWRQCWLPESHLLVRVHRALHRPETVIAFAAVAGWASHMLSDRLSAHRKGPQ